MENSLQQQQPLSALQLYSLTAIPENSAQSSKSKKLKKKTSVSANLKQFTYHCARCEAEVLLNVEQEIICPECDFRMMFKKPKKKAFGGRTVQAI